MVKVYYRKKAWGNYGSFSTVYCAKKKKNWDWPKLWAQIRARVAENYHK